MTIAVHARRIARLRQRKPKAQEDETWEEYVCRIDPGLAQRIAVRVLTQFARELAGYQPPPHQWLYSTPPGVPLSEQPTEPSAPPESLPAESHPAPRWWEEEPQIPGEMPASLGWMNVPAPPANATGTIEFDFTTRRWIPQRVPLDPRRVLTTEEAIKLPLTYDVPPAYPPDAVSYPGGRPAAWDHSSKPEGEK